MTAHDPSGRLVQRDLVVIAASAGGVEALQRLVSTLPREFPAPILVVLHVASSGTSVLPQILSRAGMLPAVFPADGDELRRGQVYVAPPDFHMLVDDGHVRLSRGPRENGHRPAADPLFRSAARSRGERVIGVVLSGLLDDGAGGLRFIKQHGGATVVQAPEDAMFAGMPKAAIEATAVDRVVPIDAMATALCELVEQEVAPDSEPGSADDDVGQLEPAIAELVAEAAPTRLSCPECGGALWEQEERGIVRYACHVGHAYSLHSLVEEQGRSLETTLWSALRALQERADMQRRLARRARSGAAHRRLETQAAEAERNAARLRELLQTVGRVAPAELPLEAR
ncbi:MAG: chemotaxis protein CheB [Thermoleophilaceae bacterium]